jgi:hypothetical protein
VFDFDGEVVQVFDDLVDLGPEGLEFVVEYVGHCLRLILENAF